MFNATKLHIELERAGIPIEGCNSDGRIDFRPEATPAQRQQAEQLKAIHNPDTLLPDEQARKDDLAEIQGTKLQALFDQNQADLAALPTATNAQLKDILAHQLQHERLILRAIRHLFSE